jgi:hypothetical protein
MSATEPESFAGTTQGPGADRMLEQQETEQSEREARRQARKAARKQQRREGKKRERQKESVEEQEHAARARLLAALGVDTGDSSGATDERE